MTSSRGSVDKSFRSAPRTPTPTALRSGGGPAGSVRKERDLESVRLWLGEGAEDILELLLEQVADRGEREIRLGLHGAGGENAGSLDRAAAAIPARRSVQSFRSRRRPSNSRIAGSDSADATKPLSAASSLSLLMTSEAAEVTLAFR